MFVYAKQTTSHPRGLEHSQVLFLTILWVGWAVPCCSCLGSLMWLYVLEQLGLEGPRCLTPCLASGVGCQMGHLSSLPNGLSSSWLNQCPYVSPLQSGQGSARTNQKLQGPPGLGFSSCHVIYTVSYWPKQGTLPAQTQGPGREDPPLHGGSSNLWGHI